MKRPTLLTGLPIGPITLLVYRYGHLYVLQGRQLTVLDGNANMIRQRLPFAPTTWGSYGGAFTLYHPYDGVAQMVGAEVAVMDVAPTSTQVSYAAPYGVPFKDGQPLVGGIEGLATPEVNGLMLSPHGPHLPVQRTSLPAYPRSALVEPDQWLAFLDQRDPFSVYNGTVGKLLFGQVPYDLVPYAYPHQGLLAGGYADGYLFSPDMGLSWRLRRLNGWGAVTERAIVRATPEHGVEILEGWW